EVPGPISEYVQRGGGRPVSALSHMAQALRLADCYAHGLLLCPSPAAPVQPFGAAEYRRATGAVEPEAIDGLALRNEVLTQTWMLAGMSSKDQDKLARPLFAQTARPIWYARHPSLSSFDPLAAALGLLGECRIESR